MSNHKFYTARGYQLLEQNKNRLTPSLEDYLEMIYRNISEHGYIRVNELALELNVKPSSVSKMVVKLSNLGFLDYEKYGAIKLTIKGMQIGSYLIWRHNTIKDFFTLIKDKENESTLEETELIEHGLSEDTVKSLEKLLKLFREDTRLLDKLKSID